MKTSQRAFVAAAITAIAAGLLSGCSLFASGPARDADGQVTESSVIKSTQLEVGDCFDFIGDGSDVAKVTVIPCTKAHNQIVVGQGSLKEGEVIAAGNLQSAVSAACKDSFTEFKATVAAGIKVSQEFLINTVEKDGKELKAYSCIASDTLESRAASEPTPEPTETPAG